MVKSGPIEKGAKLKLLRWSAFVDADQTYWDKHTKAFTQKTGVPVSIDWETWTDVQPKAATAAHVGSGPDLAIGFYDTPQQFPDKLVDLSDVADDISSKAGAWFPTPQKYGQSNGKWIGIPLGANGAEWNYRVSWAKQAGFERVPQGHRRAARVRQGDEGQRAPDRPGAGPRGRRRQHLDPLAGLGVRWDDSSTPNGKIAVNQDGTIKALEYAKQFGDQMISGGLSWHDSNNNKAFLAGQLGATYERHLDLLRGPDRRARSVAADTMTAEFPVGPVGKPTEFHLIFPVHGVRLHASTRTPPRSTSSS